MAEQIVNMSGEKLDGASLRIQQASAILSTLSVFMDISGNTQPISGHLLNDVFGGVNILLEDALTNLRSERAV